MFLQKGTHNIQKWLKYIIRCIYFIAVLSTTAVMKHPAHAGHHVIKLPWWVWWCTLLSAILDLLQQNTTLIC